METDFERYRIGEVFRSRKNRVFKIRFKGETRVAKVHSQMNSSAANAEYQLLARCSERRLLVPAPLELAENTIVMTYLEGPNLGDLADVLLSGGPPPRDRDEITIDSLAKGLANWLASFHKAFDNELCRGDTILRNFLLSSRQIYGLDFEEAHKGDPILDMGEICANILGMRPMFGRLNFNFASKVVSEYWRATGKDRSADIPEAIAMGLEHYAKFRQDGGLLMEWARKFRSERTVLGEQTVPEA